MKNFLTRTMLALSSAAAIIATSCSGDVAFAQVINPSQPATGVPVAGTGISVAGQTVSVNYGLVASTSLQGNALHAPTAIGDTTPNTAAFTTLSATSTVSGAGFSSLFASPFAIGLTTPNTGAFTTLSATGAISGAGFTSWLASPPAIGGTAANTGAFTNLSASGTVSGAGLAPITQNVLNVAALRNFNHLFGNSIQTLGYRTNGDGGGANYYIKSTTSAGFTDDGCLTIIATDGAVWGLNYSNVVNVKQCGAYGDDTHDDTASFNAATQSAATWANALRYTIEVPNSPAGYLINGTVYVRKGQTLRGVGWGTFLDLTGTPASTNNFVLGNGTGGADPGGSPVKMTNFQTSGGGGSAAAISTSAAGFEISDVFMTFPGIGINVTGADGLITNVQVDQSLSAIVLNGAQNIQITNFDLYLPNYGITFSGATHDIAISNGVIEYAQYTSELMQGATLHNINHSNVNFTMNTQYATFTGFVNWQANNSDAQWVGCSFRNMAGPAINHNTGTNNVLTFVGDVFDGAPTTSGYTSSTTAAVLSMPASGTSTYDFESTQFRNLLGGSWNATTYGAMFTVATGMTQLKLNGGLITNTPVSRFVFNNTDTPKISIKGVTGVGFYSSTGTSQQIVLPYWGASTTWRVDIKGNAAASSNLAYSAAEESIYSINYQFTTSGSTYLDKVLLWQTPSRAIPGQLNSAGGFGTTPGGAVSQAGIVLNGTICVSVVTGAATTLFDFYAETTN